MIVAILQDARYGVRRLARQPGFALVAVLSLALGIGANTAIFSVVRGVLLRPLPYHDPGRLVRLWETNPARGYSHNPVSVPNFLDWREHAAGFAGVEAFRPPFPLAMTGGAEPERIVVATVTPGLFPLLGVAPAAGRGFDAPDGGSAGPDAVVLADLLWQRRFGGDPGIIGKIVRLEGEPCVVAGVMPPGFSFPATGVEAWTLLQFGERSRLDRKSHSLHLVGRLRDGVELRAAQAEMDLLASQAAREHPEFQAGWGASVLPLHEDIVGSSRPALLTLLAAVAVVLLIACCNVANLLLADGTRRAREIALRAAVGAGRGRIVRQLLTESLLVAGLGGGAGLLLAAWGVDALKALAPPGIPRLDEIRIDGGTFAFATLVTAVVGAAVGLLPGWRLSGVDPLRGLKQGGRSAEHAAGGRVGNILVMAEVALCLVLTMAAGLLTRSFGEIRGVPLGFEPRGLLTVPVYLPLTSYADVTRQNQMFGRLQEEAAAVPGVRYVALTSEMPLGGAPQTRSFWVEGRPAPTAAERTDFPYRVISPGYFRTLGVPLLQGRDLRDADGEGAPLVLVVNRALARRVWPGENAVGRRLSFRGDDGPWHEVVGVVGDAADYGLEAETRPAFFAPQAQRTWSWLSWGVLLVRVDGEIAPVAGVLRARLRTVDPDLPLPPPTPMTAVVSRSLHGRGFQVALVGGFAVLALVLAAIGIYGVVSHLVGERAWEFGVRLALGARPADVLRLVLRRTMAVVGAGIACGAAACLLLAQTLRPMLFGVRPTDPATFAAVSLLVAAVAFAACWIPARRATRCDPAATLRAG